MYKKTKDIKVKICFFIGTAKKRKYEHRLMLLTQKVEVSQVLQTAVAIKRWPCRVSD